MLQRFYSILRLVVSILFTLVVSISASAAQPTILIVGMIDEAMPGHQYTEYKKLYQKMYPNHEIILALSKFHKNQESTAKYGRSEVLDRLQGIDFSGKVVSHIILATHSNTFQYSDSSRYTYLLGLGRFDEHGPDEELAEVLDIFRHKVSSKVTVVLTGCSTLCGTKQEVESRAQSLMNYIGASDGTLFGANTSTTKTGSVLLRRPFDWVKMAFFGGVSSLLFLPLMYIASGSAQITSLMGAGIVAAIMIPDLIDYAQHWSEYSSVTGWFLQMKNRNIERSTHLSPISFRDKIYGLHPQRLSCSDFYL